MKLLVSLLKIKPKIPAAIKIGEIIKAATIYFLGDFLIVNIIPFNKIDAPYVKTVIEITCTKIPGKNPLFTQNAILKDLSAIN